MRAKNPGSDSSSLFLIQNPEQLAGVGQGRLAQERSTDMAELEVLRQREMAEKRTRALQRSNRWVAEHSAASGVQQPARTVQGWEMV